VEPRVYWRLTDNWLELSVRFLCTDHGVREVKDAMSREVLHALDAAGVQIASASFVINKLPTLSIAVARSGTTSAAGTVRDRR
jgi:hypothetical protein